MFLGQRVKSSGQSMQCLLKFLIRQSVHHISSPCIDQSKSYGQPYSRKYIPPIGKSESHMAMSKDFHCLPQGDFSPYFGLFMMVKMAYVYRFIPRYSTLFLFFFNQ